MSSKVSLNIILPDTLQTKWNVDSRLIFLRFETSANVINGHRLETMFRPGQEAEVEILATPLPDYAVDDPSAELTFRGDSYDGEVLGRMSALGLHAPMTTLVRTCNAYQASPGAPSFSCPGTLLMKSGELDICGDAEVARLDGEALERYLAFTGTLTPDEKEKAWARYRYWIDARFACNRDMACASAAAWDYLEELPRDETPAGPLEPDSAALETLRTAQGLVAEAERHGIPFPELRAIKGRTAYVTPDCDYSCGANVFAIHDIGPDESVPLNTATDLEVVAEIGPVYGSDVKLNHLRLGFPLPPRFAESDVPAISRSIATIDADGRAMQTYSDAPRSWADEAAARQENTEYQEKRAKAEERARLQRLATHFADETARRDRLVAAGHVYRASEFWTDFYYPDTIRGIFEGGRLAPDAPALRSFVGGFIVAFNRNCGNFMPADAVPFTETAVTRVVNGLGFELSRSSQSRSFRVQKELAPYFARLTTEGPTQTEITAVLGTVQDLMAGRIDLQGMIAPVAGNAIDAQRMVNSHSCQGPAVRQLLDNLAANANGTPTPLEAGYTIPGAPSETDPAPDPKRASSLGDSCMRASGYASDSTSLCSCVKTEVAPQLGATARELALADYRPAAVGWFHGGAEADTAAGRAFQACVSQLAR
ncbi:hypothetical protein [Roseovarius arcticus]|uniref:hypothetical protein n=1 Tax=Roseovarius arcticus TaxID=2547404 RepID=UPI001110EB0B|nr:hypothetical protein [Roseovarius arcticus]